MPILEELSAASIMTYEFLLYEISQGVATITLNNPERMNAFGKPMERELRVAMASAAADADVRVIVLTGAGRAFCGGADMSSLQKASVAGQRSAPTTAPEPRSEGLEGNFQHRLSWLLRIPKPVIAAINGPMAGIGFSLALYCDFRYMVASARMTTSFARRGLIAEHGTSWMLPRLIGPMNALDLLLTGRTITGLEGAELGLVRALPAADFMESVQKKAIELASLSSPRSTAVIKRQVYDALFQSLDEASEVGDHEEALSFQSADFKEGVAHFLEKRAPQFLGR